MQAHKEGEKRVRRLFEAAVDVYGAEDADLWLAYTRFEVGVLRGLLGMKCSFDGRNTHQVIGDEKHVTVHRLFQTHLMCVLWIHQPFNASTAACGSCMLVPVSVALLKTVGCVVVTKHLLYFCCSI